MQTKVTPLSMQTKGLRFLSFVRLRPFMEVTARRRPNLRIAPATDPSPGDIRQALHEPGRLVADGDRCPTCLTTIHGRYCQRCGEARLRERPRSVAGFLKHAALRLFDADNRLFLSLYLLLFRPGTLTTRFLCGNRKPHLGPLQLFALVNVAFVLLAVNVGPDTFRTPLRYHVTSTNFYHQEVAQRWVNAQIGAPEGWSYFEARTARDSLRRAQIDAAEAGLPPEASTDALGSFEEYAETFNQQANRLSETLIFLFIPAIAVWFWIVYRVVGTVADVPARRSARGLLPHVVHATHVMTAVLLLTVGVLGIVVLLLAIDVMLGSNLADLRVIGMGLLDVLIFSFLASYLGLSFRRVWRLSIPWAVVCGVVSVLVFFNFLLIYRAVLFFIGFALT